MPPTTKYHAEDVKYYGSDIEEHLNGFQERDDVEEIVNWRSHPAENNKKLMLIIEYVPTEEAS